MKIFLILFPFLLHNNKYKNYTFKTNHIKFFDCKKDFKLINKTDFPIKLHSKILLNDFVKILGLNMSSFPNTDSYGRGTVNCYNKQRNLIISISFIASDEKSENNKIEININSISFFKTSSNFSKKLKLIALTSNLNIQFNDLLFNFNITEDDFIINKSFEKNIINIHSGFEKNKDIHFYSFAEKFCTSDSTKNEVVTYGFQKNKMIFLNIY